MTSRSREAEAEERFAQKLEATRDAAIHLDAVRVLMRESVAPEVRDDVFNGEVTGVTRLPDGHH